MVPCISFVFELTPLKVKKTERRAGSFASFATRTAALIGGLFTVHNHRHLLPPPSPATFSRHISRDIARLQVAGIVDSVLYSSARRMEKLNVGKQG